MSSTNASDTWAATSQPWARWVPGPASAERMRPSVALAPAARRSAGTDPKKRPVASETSSAKASTDPSIEASNARGVKRPANFTRRPRLPRASATPSTPPRSARTVLSVRSWRASRPRPAPSAWRTASSCPRRTARARARLATFAHAIRSTSAVVPMRISSVGRAFATRSSLSGVTAAS